MRFDAIPNDRHIGYFHPGSRHQAIERSRPESGDHVIALPPFILGEVGRVLSYPRMQALYRLTGDEIHDHIQFLKSVSCLVEPAMGIPIVLSLILLTTRCCT